jgi:DNA-binding Lrp family transcriptional regulator
MPLVDPAILEGDGFQFCATWPLGTRERRYRMGANAYIMLKVEPARTLAVAERLRSLPGVAEVHEVLGPFDIIAEVDAPTPEDLALVLRTKIRAIAGVTETVTCTWLD